jgi:hypothetical protein
MPSPFFKLLSNQIPNHCFLSFYFYFLMTGELTNITGVATSVRTFELAKSLGIPLTTLDECPRLDGEVSEVTVTP